MVPGARDGHSACVLAKSMFIFGGYEQLVSNLKHLFGNPLGKRVFLPRALAEAGGHGHIYVCSCLHFITRQSYEPNLGNECQDFSEEVVGRSVKTCKEDRDHPALPVCLTPL